MKKYVAIGYVNMYECAYIDTTAYVYTDIFSQITLFNKFILILLSVMNSLGIFLGGATLKKFLLLGACADTGYGTFFCTLLVCSVI